NLLLGALAIVAAIYAATALLVFVFQDHLVYPAPRGGIRHPREAGLADAEPFEVRSGGLALHGWILMPPREPADASGDARRESRPALLVFHGNGENVTLDAEWLDGLRREGLAVAAIDYRGYGLSEGAPSESGLIEDGFAALAALRARPEVDANKIVLLGSSLGTGVAVAVASREPVAGVVLQSAFASLRAIAKRQFPWLPSLLLRSPFDSLARIGAVRAPILFLHGTNDTLIPIADGRALAAAAPNVSEFVAVEGAGHNDLVALTPGYGRRIRDFALAATAVARR
ncbi:MAG TPA: alpha/beta hydrolase, partial [Planctomycetota bacterium]|nr:alpha/beta hydrolase [Planctomycetota bacterium]